MGKLVVSEYSVRRVRKQGNLAPAHVLAPKPCSNGLNGRYSKCVYRTRWLSIGPNMPGAVDGKRDRQAAERLGTQGAGTASASHLDPVAVNWPIGRTPDDKTHISVYSSLNGRWNL